MCVLGLDCTAPEIGFGFAELHNCRCLMDKGAWSRLESITPPITGPAWMCLSTSQDPGSLGVYGFRANYTLAALASPIPLPSRRREFGTILARRVSVPSSSACRRDFPRERFRVSAALWIRL
jgi:hypothetical protein